MFQILQRCHAVLQEIPSGLRQKRPASIADSLHHMTACITFHMAKVRLYTLTDHFSWRIAYVFHQQMNNTMPYCICYPECKILIFISICQWKISLKNPGYSRDECHRTDRQMSAVLSEQVCFCLSLFTINIIHHIPIMLAQFLPRTISYQTTNPDLDLQEMYPGWIV